MTGGLAHANAEIGVAFDAWDNYIRGRNLELEPDRRILQAWRTAEFTAEEEDSLLEITLVSEGIGTRLTLSHSNLPAHGEKYQQGWIEAYFEPMQAYFQALE
jgi:activator of HSP90 ATPase